MGVAPGLVGDEVHLRNGDVIYDGFLPRNAGSVWPDLRSRTAGPRLSGAMLVCGLARTWWVSVLCSLSVSLPTTLAARETVSRASHSRSRTPETRPEARSPSPRIGCWGPERQQPLRQVVTRSECLFQVLCPYRGWGQLSTFSQATTHAELVQAVQRDSGMWARGYLPIGGLNVQRPVVLLPLAPAGLSTLLLHTADTSRSVVFPAQTTLRQVKDHLSRLVSADASVLSVPPALRCVLGYPDATIRLRHGDSFELDVDPLGVCARHREAHVVPSLDCVPHLSVWHMPFVVRVGGWANVWNTDEQGHSVHSRVWVPDQACWSPRWLKFSLDGSQISDSRWVPTPHLPGHGASFVVHLGLDEAHVLLVSPLDRTVTECRKLLLVTDVDRQDHNRIPQGWQLRPDIQESVAISWPRAGDVLIPELAGRLFRSTVVASSVGMRQPIRAALLWLALWVGSVDAMIAPPLEQQHLDPVPIGKFPWRVPPEARVCHESVRPHNPARIISPFTGVGDEAVIGPDSTVEEVRLQLTDAEPLWSSDVMPIWPAIWQQTAVFVPVPACHELVCVVVVSPGWQFSVLLPRRADLPWVLRFLRRSTPGPLLSLRAPLAAQPAVQGRDSAIDWRNGDVLLAFQQGGETVGYDPPSFISAAQIRSAAMWNFDFTTQCMVVLIVWRPGEDPVRTEMPAGQRWSASQQAFLGHFGRKYPGRWVPVQWAYSDVVHICRRDDSDDHCNIILEGLNGNQLLGTCQRVACCATRYSLAGIAGVEEDRLNLLGVHDSGVFPTLRDGDIVHYEISSARQSSAGALSMLAVFAGAAFAGRSGHLLGSVSVFILLQLGHWIGDWSRLSGYGPPSPLLAPLPEVTFCGAGRTLYRTLRSPALRHSLSIPAVKPHPMPFCRDCPNYPLRYIRCYLAAWGAPEAWAVDNDVWTLPLQDVMRLQADLHSLWWNRPLYKSLPRSCPPSYHCAWEGFPVWAGGVPDSLLIATDGSGEAGGSWAFVVWGLRGHGTALDGMPRPWAKRHG